MNHAAMRKNALRAIDKHGALLVYPIENRKEPNSVWSELFPRSKMRWEWDDESHNKIADVWHLRAELSSSRQVIYSKWFRNRATFFSRATCTDLISVLQHSSQAEFESGRSGLGRESLEALEILESDSPLSTRQLKAACGLEGRLMEGAYNRALKPLWQNLWIVAFGEFDDSSFPSLGIGSTRALFEDLWEEARALPPSRAWERLRAKLAEKNPFFKFAEKLAKTL